MIKKVGNLEVFENASGEIVIIDNYDDYCAVAFDECMAEKLCKMIMAVAEEIREG